MLRRGLNRRLARLPSGHVRTSLEQGFTLIELIVVMVIVVVIAGIVLANYSTSVTRAKEAALKEDLFQMRKAIDEYYADKSQYPASLETLVSERYLRAIPPDPITGSADTWQQIQSDFDPGRPSAQPGVSDVKSGSDQTGLDGTSYAEW